MPLYEYLCPKCGSRKELIRKLENTDTVLCDECSNEMSRTVGGISFSLKGSWSNSGYS